MPTTTWKPHKSATHGRLSKADRDSLPTTAFAFPKTRKEPMTDATHVRDAMSRFDQVEAVTDSERDLAFSNIKKAAKYFDIEMHEKNWRKFGVKKA
jgi:hypothetical protein